IALFAFNHDGLQLLQVSGVDAATVGKYTLRLFLPGDVNGDGTIDALDGQAVSAALGTDKGDPGYVATADANRDGVIDANDSAVVSGSFGATANKPAVVLPGSGMTHEDLQVVIPLVGLAVDPENDPLFFRIAATQHGSATLSTNGRFVFFTPDAGYIGDASFQIIANDGVSDSAPGTL